MPEKTSGRKKSVAKKPAAKKKAAPKRPAKAKRPAAAKSEKPAVKEEAAKPVKGSAASAPKQSRPIARLDYLTLFVLVAGLCLAAVNLVAIIQAAGKVSALEESRNQLLANYRRAVEQQSELAAFKRQLDAVKPEAREPIVLWSVAAFADGEKDDIESNLVKPLLGWYKLQPVSPEGVLIERRHPTSTNVSVRLFLADGSEVDFLWPDSGTADESLWLPPCGPNTPKEKVVPVSCPTGYLSEFPDVTDALLELAE